MSGGRGAVAPATFPFAVKVNNKWSNSKSGLFYLDQPNRSGLGLTLRLVCV